MILKKSLKILVFSFMTAVLCMPLKAEEDTEIRYELFDAASGKTVETFSSYTEARRFLDGAADDYDNLSIRYDGRVLYCEHALVLFDQKEDCSPVSYIHTYDRTEAQLSGCYAIDAAFIDSDGEKAEFMISADRGWISLEDVTILPVEEIRTRISCYTVFHSYLYHEIKNEMTDDNYFSIIPLSEAPSCLKDNHSYFSYDGHYFYEDLNLLLDDLKNDTHENSVNPDDPRYDYFQFVSHRTVTNVTPEEAEKWLRETLLVKGAMDHYQSDQADGTDDTLTRSQLYGQIPAFWQYQYEYGINAMMMLAEAMEESSEGRSLSAYTKNNLFAHAAYDSDEEASASRFRTVTRSVLSHAKYYLSGNFLSPLKNLYQGGNYGNKSSGMNVDYSADPYWGEQLASRSRRLDEQFGSADLDTQMIVIRSEAGKIPVRRTPDIYSYVLYRTNGNPDNAFTVTGITENQYGTWYEVYSDATLSDEQTADLSYRYDHEKDRGYIRAEDVQIILNEKEDFEEVYYTVTFDAGEGEFDDGGSSVELKVREGYVPTVNAPVLNHAVFDGWDREVTPVSEDTVYHARYKNISSALLSGKPESSYELNDRIDLHGSAFDLIFEDLSSARVELSTSMISGFDLRQEGDQYMNISFNGYSFSCPIHVSARRDSLREELRKEVLEAIDTYGDKDSLSSEEASEIISLKMLIEQNMMPKLTQSQFRQFDNIMRMAVDDRIRYIIDPNDLRLSVSGLSVSIPFGNSLEKYRYYEDTYRLQAQRSDDEILKNLFTVMADHLNSEMRDMFSLRLLKNYHEFETDEALLISLDKPAGSEEGEIFTVLYIDQTDGHIYRCYTRQSENMISFLTKGIGTYAILSRNSSNVYPVGDPVESLSEATCSEDMEAVRIKIVIGSFIAGVLLLIWLSGAKRRNSRKLEKKQTERERLSRHEMVAPSDTTVVMRLFETEVLNLTELQEYEEEIDRREEEERSEENPADMTAGMRLFETEVLNLEELQEEEGKDDQ